jgi:UbiD family decarboxylase
MIAEMRYPLASLSPESLPGQAAGGVPDFRQFISALDAHQYLLRVDKRVDWRSEIGEVSRRSDLPMLFESIQGYPGWRLFTGGLSRAAFLALALGMTPDTDWPRLVQTVRERLARPCEPITVQDGPVLEVVRIGREANLNDLPVPRWNPVDAGRYVGTWHANITKDPGTGSRNLGVYRMEILSENQATVSVSPHSHLAMHMAQAERSQRPLEMAVAIGLPEPLIVAGAAGLPYGTDELAVAGGLINGPVEVVECRTVDLEVPADAELVLEGRIRPGARVKDGPYMDYAGIPSVNSQAYLFEVTAMLHRQEPIFRGTAVGRAGAEDHQLFALLSQLGLVDLHGSTTRQAMQDALLRRRLFRLFQWTGRLGRAKDMLTGKREDASCE